MTSLGPTFYGPGTSESISKFLREYIPSETLSSDAGPWIWVKKDKQQHDPDTATRTPLEEASVILEGKAILDQVTAKLLSIETDDDIPIRSSQSKPINKMRARDEAYNAAKSELQKLAQKHKYTSGKWLIFAKPTYCDYAFQVIAKSLIGGPLRDSSADCVKISTSDGSMEGEQRHVLCLYVPNIYDKDAVKEVLDILIKHHGIEPSSTKPDLYTAISLDSTHPSRMRPVIFHTTDFYTKQEIKNLLNSKSKQSEKRKGGTPAAEREQKASKIIKSESVDAKWTPSSDLRTKLNSASKASRTTRPIRRQIKKEDTGSDSTEDDFVPLPPRKRLEPAVKQKKGVITTIRKRVDPDATESDSGEAKTAPGTNLLSKTTPTAALNKIVTQKEVDPDATESDTDPESLGLGQKSAPKSTSHTQGKKVNITSAPKRVDSEATESDSTEDDLVPLQQKQSSRTQPAFGVNSSKSVVSVEDPDATASDTESSEEEL
ncbi:hypothetical protein ABW19_dt0208471 [Dactylella cylindrospora]|nr:hypothetical protein ABW19_dt0208471 [Dactylella cylindrospora]